MAKQKKHTPRTSKIGKAISDAVAQLGENDPDADPCVVGQGGCFLSAGIEHLFVALAAKAFVDHAHSLSLTRSPHRRWRADAAAR